MLIKSNFVPITGDFNLRPAHRLAQNGCKVSGFLSIGKEKSQINAFVITFFVSLQPKSNQIISC
jgi:hypothetical protein